MGGIMVKGSAQRRVDYDQVTIGISFTARKANAHEASERVLKECEDFLATLDEKGIDISQFELKRDDVSEESFRLDSGKELYYSAVRSVQIRTVFDMETINVIREILIDSGSDTTFDIDYSLSNIESLQLELRLEALKNAKQEAEKMAGAIGKEVINLISADKNIPYSHDRSPRLCANAADCKQIKGARHVNSNKLKATNTVISEEIYTEWEIG